MPHYAGYKKLLAKVKQKLGVGVKKKVTQKFTAGKKV